MRRGIFAALMLLGACGTGEGVPDAVMVQPDRIVVRMSSGWPCVGFRTDSTRSEIGWSGRLQGCPADYPYSVKVAGGGAPAPEVLEPARGAAGPPPRVLVEITTGPGQVHQFRPPRQ